MEKIYINNGIKKNWTYVKIISSFILEIYLFIYVIMFCGKMFDMISWRYFIQYNPYLFSCADAIFEASQTRLTGSFNSKDMEWIFWRLPNFSCFHHGFNLFTRHIHQKRWFKPSNSLPVNSFIIILCFEEYF